MVLQAVRHTCRTKAALHHRLLVFSDSLVTCCACDRGRAQAWGLNSIVRRIGAYCMACGVRLGCRHVDTDRNHADEGSRRAEVQLAAWERLRRQMGWPAPPPGIGVRPLCLDSLLKSSSTLPSRAGGPKKRGGHGIALPHPAGPRPDDVGAGRAVADLPQPVLRELWWSEPVVLELFAGSKALSRKFADLGARVLSFEIEDGPQFDLSRRETQTLILQLIRSGRVSYVHLGVPCTIWSVARSVCKDSPGTRARETNFINLTLFACRVIREASRCEMFWPLENPQSSRIWGYPPIAELLSLSGAFRIDFDMCRFGRPHKKPTSILTNMAALKGLSLRCLHDYVHIHLRGKVRLEGHWVSQTKLAGEYPRGLVSLWCRLALRQLPSSSLGSTSVWLPSWLAALPTCRSDGGAAASPEGPGTLGADHICGDSGANEHHDYLQKHNVLARFKEKPDASRPIGQPGCRAKGADSSPSRAEEAAGGTWAARRLPGAADGEPHHRKAVPRSSG